MPMWSSMEMQNSNSPLMEHLSFFHDHTMILIVSITTLTMTMMISSMKMNWFNRFFLESHQTEMFWTSMPAFLLVFIALPSMKTLYMMEEMASPLITMKAMGYQWHWAYDYSNLTLKSVTSIMSSSNKMRLSTVSNSLVIPTMSPTRVMVTSKDVLHSWTIPSLGVKADATPGRMNQAMLISKRPGVMMGQCSEICGAGHSFMPIIMESPHIKSLTKMM